MPVHAVGGDGHLGNQRFAGERHPLRRGALQRDRPDQLIPGCDAKPVEEVVKRRQLARCGAGNRRGQPALLLAPLLRRLLPDNPQRASWLTPEERAELSARLTEDTPAPTGRSSGAGWDLVLFAVVYGGLYFALYALQFFLPQLVASLAHGTATLTAATLAALPYGVAALAMLAWSHRSIDRSGAQAGHITLPTTAAGSAALGAALSPMSPIVTLSWLTIAVAGILAAMPAFWSRCTAALAGPRVAVAIATVNAVASLASFAGPYATGHLKDATGTYHLALLTVAAVLAAAAACSLLLRHAGRTVCANDSEIMLHPSPATPFV